MTPARQIAISAAILVIVAGGWFAYDRRLLGAGSGAESAVQPAGPGGPAPGARGPAPGGRGGGQSVPVVTAIVEMDDAGLDVRAVGTVAAVRAITIFPEASGVVSEMTFAPGTSVSEGQPLIRLDDADQQVSVERAQIARDAAKLAADRAEQLAQSSNISTVALAEARTALQTAEIDLRSAQRELSRRTLTAPFAGTVGLTDVTPGDFVTSSKAITTLDDMTTVTVAFEVPERASGRVEAGQSIAATTEALVGQSFTGTVSAIDSRVDPVARTLKVEAKLPNDANVLKPGMALNVVLAFPGVEHPSVPSLALQWDRNGPYVWKVDSDKVARAGVQIVGRRSGIVIVSGDLAAGDEVVVEGLQRMREGVTVARAGSGGPATPAPAGGEGAADAAAPRPGPS